MHLTKAQPQLPCLHPPTRLAPHVPQAGKGRREKHKVYRDLRTPWGETFEFGSGSRALIAPEIRSRIHQLNSLDEELWKAGNELLEVSVRMWVSKQLWCVWCGLVPSKAGFYLLGASLQLP
jgi:hypothetical protein